MDKVRARTCVCACVRVRVRAHARAFTCASAGVKALERVRGSERVRDRECVRAPVWLVRVTSACHCDVYRVRVVCTRSVCM